MRRTWFWSTILTLSPAVAFAQYGGAVPPPPGQTAAPAAQTAAPAPAPVPAATAAPGAPPPVGTDPYAATATVDTGAAVGAPAGEKRGIELVARIVLRETPVYGARASGSVLLGHAGTFDALPRFYGGYRMGKIGLLLGLNFINTSAAQEVAAGSDPVELAELGWVVAPGATYEVMATPTGNLTLDLFGNILFGQAALSGKAGGAEWEQTTGTLGIDLGARMSGWLFPPLAIGLDIGFLYGKFSSELDGNDDGMLLVGGDHPDLDERSDQIMALYGALHITGIFLE